VGTFAKVMAALLLTLPLGAYIAGTLMSSQVDMPAERTPVVIDGSPVAETSGSAGTVPSRPPKPSPSPSATHSPGDDDDDDDRSGHGRGGDDDDDDDDVRVIRPTPRDLDDLEDEREDRADDLADAREERAEEAEDRAEEADDGADDD